MRLWGSIRPCVEHLYLSLCGGDFASLARGVFPEKREHPCQKGSPPPAPSHKEMKRDTQVRIFNRWRIFFNQAVSYLSEITCSTHHIFYSSDFCFSVHLVRYSFTCRHTFLYLTCHLLLYSFLPSCDVLHSFPNSPSLLSDANNRLLLFCGCCGSLFPPPFVFAHTSSRW